MDDFLQAAWLGFISAMVGWSVVTFFSDSKLGRKMSMRFRRRSSPVIGYKQAYLKADGFHGVTGHHYTQDADAVGPGFHAFYRFEDAVKHEQQGAVILEVLLSGVIRKHKLGVKASHQRVLQILFKDCWECSRPATRYQKYGSSVLLYCAEHAERNDKIRRSLNEMSRRLDDSFEDVFQLTSPADDLSLDSAFSKTIALPMADFEPTAIPQEDQEARR